MSNGNSLDDLQLEVQTALTGFTKFEFDVSCSYCHWYTRSGNALLYVCARNLNMLVN
jgi:hypothetical protein